MIARHYNGCHAHDCLCHACDTARDLDNTHSPRIIDTFNGTGEGVEHVYRDGYVWTDPVTYTFLAGV